MEEEKMSRFLPPSDEGGAPTGAEGENSLPQSASLTAPSSEGAKNQMGFREHICSLESQGRSMRQSFPEFDLRKELRDPMFARLTSPYVGLSVEDAYYAVHRKELQQAAARAVVGGISRNIQAGRLRPQENSGSQAASLPRQDYSKASQQQREELKSAIRAAAAKGEKIYP